MLDTQLKMVKSHDWYESYGSHIGRYDFSVPPLLDLYYTYFLPPN